MASPEPVLLHLSDLHFGADKTARGINDRTLCLRKLLDSLRSLDAEWRPNIVAITGDIGWSGRTNDYKKATTWLAELCNAINVGPDAFVCCPGNHDVDREVAKQIPRPSSRGDVSAAFEKVLPQYLLPSFKEYGRFCTSFGTQALLLGGKPQGLTGTTTIQGIRFVVVNTSWFSKGPDDKGKLRIGRPVIEQLELDGSLIEPRTWDTASPITVALLHHPQDWLHEDETGYWDTPGQGAYIYLAARCHVLLSGHTHEAPQGHGRAKGGGIEIGCGATFANAGHPNQYQILRFKRDRIEYLQFQYMSQPGDRRWKRLDVQTATYSDSGRPPSSEHDLSAALALSVLQQRFGRFARDYVLAKSKALTPGLLPTITPLSVERNTPSNLAHQRHRSEVVERLWLRDAVADTARVIVWGDLGTGKSTLVASLADDLNSSGSATAVLLSATGLASQLPTPPRALSVEAISHYLRTMHFQEAATFSLADVIARSDETIIIVDGLDEVNAKTAKTILQGLDALPVSFPRVRVIATSRHVPDDYALGEDWMPVSVARLSESERRAILFQAARASGISETEATEASMAVFTRITGDALLDDLATSPLALRLLYRRLTGVSKMKEVSLAELLYGLLIERLHGWELSDAKENPAPAFCDAMPTAESRATLLSALTECMDGLNRVPRLKANECLRAHPLLLPLSEQVKSQAIEFFRWTGLIQINDDHVEFAFRPLFEIAQVPGILDRLGGAASMLDPASWRIVGFTAALERARGTLLQIRDALSNYVSAHVDSPNWAVPACFIAAEAGDQALAEKVIGALGTRRFERPLYQFEDQQRTSIIAIAKTISLAGDAGFEWFFSEYLDPRYPWLNRGSHTPEKVLEEWVALTAEHISPRQAELLTEIPRPHVDADSWATHRIVPLAVLAVPASMSSIEQLDILPRLLTHHISTIIVRAKERLRTLALREPLAAQAAFLRHIVQGYENATVCAQLWLESASGERPPQEVIRAVFRARGNWGRTFYDETLRAQVIDRVGEPAWHRFSRWELASEDPPTAVGAALETIDRQPAMTRLLEEQLMSALQEGNPVKEAELLLASALALDAERSASSLAMRIARSGDGSSHPANAGWWRLFLDLLVKCNSLAPDLLAQATGGLGANAIARDGGLRQRFLQLSLSDRGPEYIEALNVLLRFGTAAQRYGAGRILVCMRANLVEALLTCARATLDHLNHTWEWDAYCTNIYFPPAVIDALVAREDTLSDSARVFVLRLAVADGRRINLDAARFVLSQTRIHSGFEPLISSDVGFEILLELLHGSDEGRASEGAAQLLRHHRDKLGKELMTCEVLAFGPHGFPLPDCLGVFRELRENPGRRTAVRGRGGDLAMKFGHKFALGLLAEVIDNGEAWRDLLWTLLHEHSPLDNEESLGWAVLAIGNTFPDVRVPIGLAARSLCDDERVRNEPHQRTLPWCALFANEFGALSTNDLSALVKEYRARWRHNSAASALIARAKPQLSTRATVPSPSSTRAEAVPVTALADVMRDGADLPASACSTIAHTLYDEREPEDLVSLAASGARARVLSASLAFIYGQRMDPEWALKSVDNDVWSETSNVSPRRAPC